jgi:hypothetical protein
MSNPDTNGSNIDTLSTAIPVAIFFLLITIFIFQIRDSIPSFTFTLILWLGFPIIMFIITSIVNVISQYVSCKTTNVGKAMLGSLPTFATIFAGLGVASISYCRIPIASVFTPLIVGETVDVTKNKSNASVNAIKNGIYKLTLENIESKYPVIAGISYGFYTMFAVLFGMVIGNGLSTIC